MRGACAAGLYLAAWALVLLTGIADHDGLALSLTIGASLLAGTIARNRWVLVVTLAIIPLAAAQPCDDIRERCEIAAPLYAAMFFVPASGVLVALGIAAGKAIDRRRIDRTRRASRGSTAA